MRACVRARYTPVLLLRRSPYPPARTLCPPLVQAGSYPIHLRAPPSPRSHFSQDVAFRSSDSLESPSSFDLSSTFLNHELN